MGEGGRESEREREREREIKRAVQLQNSNLEFFTHFHFLSGAVIIPEAFNVASPDLDGPAALLGNKHFTTQRNSGKLSQTLNSHPKLSRLDVQIQREV